MKTKLFIDQLYRAANGALSRLELLQRLNSAQNELFSNNVLEMREMGSVTVAQTPQTPTFLAATLNSSGEIGSQATYAINDAFSMARLYGAVNTTQYFRVVVPFTYASSTLYADVANCCLPIQHLDWALGAINTVAYATGAVIASGNTVWDPTSGRIFRSIDAFTVTADDIDADIESHHLVLDFDEGATTTGAEPATGAAYPTYVEIDDLREVTTVGVLADDGTFSEVYTPRIVQSKAPGLPVRIYVDSDLPLDTALDIEGWRWPTQLTSENTDMEIPEIHQNGLVRTVILGAVEEEAYGSINPQRVQREKDQRKDWFDYVNRDKKRPRTERKIGYNPLAG